MARQAITVRMRNVGFGDMFLVEIPGAGDRPRRVLIDCGVHGQGKLEERSVEAAIGHLLEEVKAPDGVPTIDVVVATHRHADHISGFGDARWSDVRVGAVWMPWTEDPDDPEALGLVDRQAEAARYLQRLLNERSGPLHGLAADMLEDLLGARNASAMRTLREGFSPLPRRRTVRRRYLSSRSRPLSIPGTDGARVHVLGPARSEEILSELELPPEQRHLSTGGDGEEKEDGAPLSPFDARFCCQGDDVARLKVNHLLPEDDREDIADLLDDPEGLTAQHKSASNSSSLVLAIEMGRAVLVFAGDAEWRSWRTILADSKARALLGRASLLKVGHHSSFNATPVELVKEVLPPRPYWALVSTLEGRPFPTIPHERLLAALKEGKARVVRSDGVDLPPDTGAPDLVVGDDGGFYEVKVPI